MHTQQILKWVLKIQSKWFLNMTKNSIYFPTLVSISALMTSGFASDNLLTSLCAKLIANYYNFLAITPLFHCRDNARYTSSLFQVQQHPNIWWMATIMEEIPVYHTVTRNPSNSLVSLANTYTTYCGKLAISSQRPSQSEACSLLPEWTQNWLQNWFLYSSYSALI